MSLRGALDSATSAHGRAVIGRYILLATTANLAWEVAQLPLYTIWRAATTLDLSFAVVHCTAGDAIILGASLLAAIVLAGGSDRPRRRRLRVNIVATALGVAYTVFSEFLNVEIRRSWAYAAAMPLLPLTGTGLTPFLQWLVIPPLALALTTSSRASLLAEDT